LVAFRAPWKTARVRERSPVRDVGMLAWAFSTLGVPVAAPALLPALAPGPLPPNPP